MNNQENKEIKFTNVSFVLINIFFKVRNQKQKVRQNKKQMIKQINIGKKLIKV